MFIFQSKELEKNNKKKINRQPSIEEDAMFIRKTIEEIGRGSSRFRDDKDTTDDGHPVNSRIEEEIPSTSKGVTQKHSKSVSSLKEKETSVEDILDENKRKDVDKSNGKKKSKSRARLEREQSKPSESDTEQDVDTVTVEIPRRRKRPRKPTERPRTPPMAHYHTDSEGEVNRFY